MRSIAVLQIVAWLMIASTAHSFTSVQRSLAVRTHSSATPRFVASVDSAEEATRILSEFDKVFSQQSEEQKQQKQNPTEGLEINRGELQESIHLLNNIATDERNKDPAQGRCLLGICASSAEEGIGTLKAWVTGLGLPRGLLHGMDKEGVPIDLSGGVYIKYNSGGVYTFEDIRKSGLGFDALWKPGDALLEPYDGTYRGVYFQVELQDEEFRQFLVPLDRKSVV